MCVPEILFISLFSEYGSEDEGQKVGWKRLRAFPHLPAFRTPWLEHSMALCRRAVRIWLSRFQAIAAGSEGLAAAPHAVSAAEASWGAEVGRGQQQARHCSSACSSSATPTFAMSGVTSSAATRDYSSKARQPNMASAGGLATHSPASVAASLVSSLDSLPRER